jgi:septal ring factor EnvC (AmiA/AmiB activator)
MKTFSFIIFIVLLLAAQVFFVSTVSAETGSVDAKTIERLERLIREQQQQLEYMQQQLNELKQTAAAAQIEAKEAKSAAEDIGSRVNRSGTAKAADEQAPVEKVVTSAQERVKLALSGWVNRAVNIVDDGKDTRAYFVDNDNAESRIRLGQG